MTVATADKKRKEGDRPLRPMIGALTRDNASTRTHFSRESICIRVGKRYCRLPTLPGHIGVDCVLFNDTEWFGRVGRRLFACPLVSKGSSWAGLF